jgi:hypothetical protein
MSSSSLLRKSHIAVHPAGFKKTNVLVLSKQTPGSNYRYVSQYVDCSVLLK